MIRRLGLVRHIPPWVQLWIGGHGAAGRGEERFSGLLLDSIRGGDVVWDVGANVGVYTCRISEAVGPSGRVCAFEPNPRCFRLLEEEIARRRLSNVRALNVALGRSHGDVVMEFAEQPNGQTHRVVGQVRGLESGRTMVVKCVSGDELVGSGEVGVPQVVKVDVEGYEVELLEGLKTTLRTEKLRAVFCEVHFGLLESRGLRYGPVAIRRLLRSCGLRRHRWVGASHLVASR